MRQGEKEGWREVEREGGREGGRERIILPYIVRELVGGAEKRRRGASRGERWLDFASFKAALWVKYINISGYSVNETPLR
jgi:hypothetical protein